MSRLCKRLIVVAVLLGFVLANIFSPLRVRRVSIRLAPEPVFCIGGLAVTNTLLSSWLATLLLVGFAIVAVRKLVDTPEPSSLQNLVETVIEALYGFVEGIGGSRTSTFFPVVGTFFLFILTSNWLALLPGVGSVGFWEEVGGERVFVPLLRGSTTDLNTTIALAACSVVSSQVYGIRFLGLTGYGSRFVAIGKFVAFFRHLARGEGLRISLLLGGALDQFIGLLEVFEELTKILSFSFRLFGNIFGGEVLLVVMAFLVPYGASIPFMGLELFGGFIQALIFAVLTAAFLGRATAARGPAGEHGT